MATHSLRREFAVTPPATDPRLSILFLVLLPELLILAGAFVLLHPANVATALQPSAYAHKLAVLPVALVLVCATAWLFRSAQRRGIALIDGMLDVRATLYRRTIPVTDFDLGNARVLNLDEHTEWRPFIKTKGFGTVGLRAGWFRSRNWTSLFCLITDRQRVLLLPLRAGGAVLLSVESPGALLDALRTHGG